MKRKYSKSTIRAVQKELRRMHSPLHKLGCGCDAIYCTAMRLGLQSAFQKAA